MFVSLWCNMRLIFVFLFLKKLAIWIIFFKSTVFFVLLLCVHYSGINRVLNWLDYRRTLIKRLPSVLFMEAQRLHRRPTMFWFYRQGGYLQGLPKSIYRSGSNNYIIIKSITGIKFFYWTFCIWIKNIEYLLYRDMKNVNEWIRYTLQSGTVPEK